MLEKVACLGPVSSPTDEPDHLLATSKGVDNGSSGGGREGTAGVWGKCRNCLGNGGVGNHCRIMPKTSGAHTGVSVPVGQLTAKSNVDNLVTLTA